MTQIVHGEPKSLCFLMCSSIISNYLFKDLVNIDCRYVDSSAPSRAKFSTFLLMLRLLGPSQRYLVRAATPPLHKGT